MAHLRRFPSWIRVHDVDPYELERRSGHRPQRYIARHTNPPERVAAAFAEDL